MRHLTGCYRLANAPAVGRDTQKGSSECSLPTPTLHSPRAAAHLITCSQHYRRLPGMPPQTWNGLPTFSLILQISYQGAFIWGVEGVARITNQTQI